MDVNAISETEPTYAFYQVNESAHWNGRAIQELSGENLSPVLVRTFSTSGETQMSLGKRKICVEPKMSRAADESEAKVTGGYDDERGVFVEGSWTWTWKDLDDKKTSSDNNGETTSLDPPDSRDRDFDKDVNGN